MTSDLLTVGPDTSATYAAELLAERGVAALPLQRPATTVPGVVAVEVTAGAVPAGARAERSTR